MLNTMINDMTTHKTDILTVNQLYAGLQFYRCVAYFTIIFIQFEIIFNSISQIMRMYLLHVTKKLKI